MIVKGLIKEKIANLEEFRFFFHDGAQVETWVTKLGVTDDKMVQIARLRRAFLWSAPVAFRRVALETRVDQQGFEPPTAVCQRWQDQRHTN